MTHISEHHTKEEGEGNYSKDSGVGLFVIGNTISVYNFLKCPCKLIVFKVCGRNDCMVAESLEVCSMELQEFFSDKFFISYWTPEEANVSTSTLSHCV